MRGKAAAGDQYAAELLALMLDDIEPDAATQRDLPSEG
jgi:hypothetical protein